MTMYHMAMPPQFGGAQPPPMHSSIFPGPLLPPVNHSHSVHSFPPQPSGNNVDTPSSTLLHSSPIISQGSTFYPPHQPSVYINPYLATSHAQNHMQPSNLMPHHGLRNTSHSHTPNIGYATGNTGIPLFHANHIDRGIHDPTPHFSTSRRQPLSVDKELLEEMNTLHLGYLETEDSPHKMEQREKLEGVIMEHLSMTPHTQKFTFHQVLDVLENSVMTKPNFSGHLAACAFEALAQYAANLISQPWRKEFREIKLYNGFWVHQVASQLSGAEYILELLGYVCGTSKPTPSSPSESGVSWRRKSPEYYVLQGVIDPDLIARLALDCMIAYCECQCLNKIKEGVTEYDLSWGQILQYRQLYIGGIDLTLRHLLFTLRQRINIPPYPTPISPDSNVVSSPPPVPARQSSSYAAACASSFANPSSKAPTPTALLRSPLEPKLEASASVDDSHSKSSLHLSPDNQKNIRSLSLTGAIIGSGAPSPGKMGLPECSYQEDRFDGVHSLSCGSIKGVGCAKVPTAKLIDLESSSDNVPHYKSNHLLPKVLPHAKPSNKGSSHSNASRFNYSAEAPECPPPTQPPPEAFQAGTLEEHLEATLNLVKNPSRNPGQGAKGHDGNSSETWDYFYKKLEKKGYSKDIGDRGDILHDMARHKSYAEANNAPSGKDVNLNLNNQCKEVPKNRPLAMSQALQQFNLHETPKEKVDRPPSSKSSHSISHAYVHENHKRNSLYDNVSGAGFETANQDSDECDDRRSSLLKKVNNACRQESSPRSDSCSKNCDSGSTSHKSATFSNRLNDLPPKSKYLDSHERNSGTGDKNWACVTCTYENKVGVTICEMCGKSKDPGPDAKPLESGGKQCPLCTLINERNVEICSACGVDLKGSSTYI